MKKNENVAMLEIVAAALDELREKLVFVGGATTALYIDDPASPPPTPSEDVDCVIEIASRPDFRNLEAELRKKGFEEPIGDENPPICRKYYRGIKVDVMPTDEAILGFSNEWYPSAIAHKERFQLPSGMEIYIFSAPFFLATKFAAYRDRGKNEDLRTSQDIEDICALLEGCTRLQEMVLESPQEAQKFIQKELSALLEQESIFEEAAHGFIRRHRDPVTRARLIIEKARAIAKPMT